MDLGSSPQPFVAAFVVILCMQEHPVHAALFRRPRAAARAGRRSAGPSAPASLTPRFQPSRVQAWSAERVAFAWTG